MKRACLLAVALAGCAAESNDIHYTGETRRFVIDKIEVPKTNLQARELGVDLNHDHTVDNQLGMVLSTLGSFGDLTTHGPDMIGAGVIASSVELIADDFTNDDTVALRYVGADGEDADLVGGALRKGAFEPAFAGSAIVHLPVFVDADPVVVRVSSLRATLVADGHGGFDAVIAGAVDPNEAFSAAFTSVDQMLTARPRDHVTFFHMLDANHDNVVTQHEFETNSLLVSLLSPDVTIDGHQSLSIGFRVHLSPCADGRCMATPAAQTCFDRVLDGNETDLDCGGSCGTCTTGATCSSAADCESGACDGTCAAPTCFDGRRDGFETDVDCGSGCGGCAVGKACYSDADCTSHMCGAPCTGVFCEDYSLDKCR